MARTFARHGVEAYNAWRESYDGFHGRRRELGARDEGVTPHLRERMESAGVRWPAEFWIVEEA